MKTDVKKEIFAYLEENQHLLDNVECNDILLKKFYPKVKPEEIKAKKKYISKVKNEFINRDNLLFDDKGDVIAKNIFTEPKKNTEPHQVIAFDKKLVEEVASEVVNEKLILTLQQQKQLIELLNKPEPQHPIKQEPIIIKDVDGEKERYNIRILISAMEKLKKFAKKNNSNASAVIENLINQYL